MRRGVVEIGDADGRIAVYLNESSAIDLAYLYDSRDPFRSELLNAVSVAYPAPDEDAE